MRGPQLLVLGGAQSAAPVGTFRPEVGRWSIDGRFWRREDGSIANRRGVSMFAYMGRVRRGEDVRPQQRWMQAIGVNSPRLFVDWTPDTCGHYGPDGSLVTPGVAWDGHNLNFDDPHFPNFLSDELGRLKAIGFRCEVVPITEYKRSFDDMRRILAITYEILGADRFHLCEAVNEPGNAGIDVVRLMDGIDRHGVLSAYGIPPIATASGWQKPPVLDYLTWRSDRSPQHFYRSSKDAEELWPFGVPVENDEPKGAADYIHEGSGARTNSIEDVIGQLAIGELFGGNTLHIQCGLEGRAPADDEPRSAEIARKVGELRAAIPEDTYTGQYTRAGGGISPAFPIALTPADVHDDPHCTGYASIHDGHAIVVVPHAVPEFAPTLANGWTGLERIGPHACGIYRVTR